MKDILDRLGLAEENPGAWIGSRALDCRGGELLESVNPATGEVIARVATANRDDYEEIEFPEPIGRMEAFVAGGGTSTAPWTFEGKVQTYQNKTLRWKGHFEQWKTVIDMGLMDLDPVDIGGVRVSPRDVLHACVAPKIMAGEDDRDFVIVGDWITDFTYASLCDGKLTLETWPE